MPPLPPDREEGWETWLRELGLWDDTHTEERAYCQYLTFSCVKFGAAPQEVWPKLFEAGRSMHKVGMREYGMCIAAVATRAAALM